MALNQLGLGFVFTARDLASGTMRRVGQNFNVMSKKTATGAKGVNVAAASAAAGIGLLVAGAGTLGGALALANQAGEFEQGIAKVGAISRATSDELAMLSARAKQAGIDTQFSPTEATEGLANLAAQGFNAAQSAELLGPALDLAAGGQISIADASATTAAAVKVFSLSMDEASLAADQLLRISNVTALQASDLQLALGTVSRGAVAAKQSIDEMLPSIGLVKNTGVDASVAASSVSSALQFMAKNAKKFKALGVDVTDAQGNFRPFMDIVLDTQTALSDVTNAAERSATAMELFGRFGITAFTGITSQVNAGIPDATGKILKGAEAVEFLRSSMRNAHGAAAEFKDQLLNTFQGQKTLLLGSLQTLGVSVGQTFTKVFKPIVAFIIRVVNQIIAAVNAIPEPIKDVLGKVVLVFGVIASIAGVGVLAAVAFAAIAAAAKTVAVALGVAAGAFAAVGAAIGVIMLAWKGYQQATTEAERRTNFFVKTWEKIKLAFTAVAALITGKPVSKAIVDDLQKAENQGVFAFVQSVGRLIRRIKAFADAVAIGFRYVMKEAGPVFDAFMEAFQDLAGELGFAGDGFNQFAGSPLKAFIRVGFVVGKVVAKIILGIVRAVTLVTKYVSGFIAGVKTAFAVFAPVWEVLKTLVADTVEQFKKLIQEVFPGVEKGADGAGGFVKLLGKAAGVVATVIRFAVVPAVMLFVGALNVGIRVWRFMVGLIKKGWEGFIKPAFEGISTWITETVVPAFKTMKDKVVGFIEPIVDIIKTLVEWITSAVDAIDEFFGIGDKVKETAESLANLAGFTLETAPTALGINSPEEPVPLQFADSFGLLSGGNVNIPDAAPAGAAIASTGPRQQGESEKALRELARELRSRGVTGPELVQALQRAQFNVAIDGQKTSDALRSSSRDTDNREFRQVAPEG